MERKVDFFELAQNILARQQSEKQITDYKVFYKTYLKGIKNRSNALNALYPICERFRRIAPKSAFSNSTTWAKLEADTESVLKRYFGTEILKLYQMEIPAPPGKVTVPGIDKSFWLALLGTLANTFDSLNEKYKEECIYKNNFLSFVYDCLYSYGLHNYILQRDSDLYKRYNVIIVHQHKSKSKQCECRILLKAETLQSEVLFPYEKQLPIMIHGKLILPKSIYSVRITSTLLLDDELELFALNRGFLWTSATKDEIDFAKNCQNETDSILRNPHLNKDDQKFRNQIIYFVDPDRIKQIRKIKSKKFDLAKLIRICEELNNASATKNHITIPLLVRAVIDHIPPIFGHVSFSQVANNYSNGGRSFKKAMIRLENSLRNIADINIHSQVRSKEVLPTVIQADFTPELDLLLSEVVRILK